MRGEPNKPKVPLLNYKQKSQISHLSAFIAAVLIIVFAVYPFKDTIKSGIVIDKQKQFEEQAGIYLKCHYSVIVKFYNSDVENVRELSEKLYNNTKIGDRLTLVETEKTNKKQCAIIFTLVFFLLILAVVWSDADEDWYP